MYAACTHVSVGIIYVYIILHSIGWKQPYTRGNQLKGLQEILIYKATTTIELVM